LKKDKQPIYLWQCIECKEYIYSEDVLLRHCHRLVQWIQGIEGKGIDMASPKIRIKVSGYTAYSEMKKSQGEIVTPEKLEAITVYFNKWTNKSELLRFLMNNNTFDSRGVMDHMGCVQSESIEVVSKLSQASCISKRGAYYVKAPAFVSYLKSELKLKVVRKEPTIILRKKPLGT